MHAERPDTGTERGVDVEAHAQRAAGGTGGAGHQVDLGNVVDHHRHHLRSAGVLREVTERVRVDAGIADQDVLDAVRHEPERLAHRVGHDAAEAGARQDLLENRAHPHGLARHADGDAAGASHEVDGVGLERVEVDDDHRCRQVRGRRIEPFAERPSHATAGHQASTTRASRLRGTLSPKPGATITTTTARTTGSRKPIRSELPVPIAPTNTPPTTAPT
ncbi:hypothetical protein GALL_346670 [mine drainage metagenome]|uniref:Uncharacterized protein n=1 Tax=mine drainage metagenome TaxID=410659 RepID=A0A1J5QUG6_9ZZZZ